ncbi:uncharacterized protein FOMMEDRAFT_81431, partial [Fomitiporia mediterranea MF3/22]|uniref:uncharacterized protein n=1 Tax=Fomitiporia mediterranea (strain MF3/22) TaxID=694068 RepID=UPI0004407D94
IRNQSNGKIPTITHEGFPVFETSAILLYAAQQYNKENIFSRDAVKDPKGYSEILQCLIKLTFSQHGSVVPMQGQSSKPFQLHPREVVSLSYPYIINRYQNETKRLYGVLESCLSKQDYLVGNEYSIADIKAFGWARALERVGLSFSEFQKLRRGLTVLKRGLLSRLR